MALTAEQLKIRKAGITATDITKIVGVSPYGGAVDVLLDKQGLAGPFVETDRVRWGNILEGPIRVDYARRHQMSVEEPSTLRGPEDWMLATPDGLVYEMEQPDPVRGLEIKTHTVHLGHHYGEPGTDDVPAWELVQCAWGMAVCDLDRWDLVAFVDGVPTDYVIMRDLALERDLIEAGQAFWQDHILGGEPIAPDGSGSFTRDVARRFPRHTETTVTADQDTEAAICVLRELRGTIRDQKIEETKLIQQIKMAIGDGQAIEFEGGKKNRITWRLSRDINKTDWQGAYKEVMAGLATWASIKGRGDDHHAIISDLWDNRESILEQHTDTRPGSRRFCVPRSWR